MVRDIVLKAYKGPTIERLVLSWRTRHEVVPAYRPGAGESAQTSVTFHISDGSAHTPWDYNVVTLDWPTGADADQVTVSLEDAYRPSGIWVCEYNHRTREADLTHTDGFQTIGDLGLAQGHDLDALSAHGIRTLADYARVDETWLSEMMARENIRGYLERGASCQDAAGAALDRVMEILRSLRVGLGTISAKKLANTHRERWVLEAHLIGVAGALLEQLEAEAAAERHEVDKRYSLPGG